MIFFCTQITPWFLHVTDIMPAMYDTSFIEEFKRKGKILQSMQVTEYFCVVHCTENVKKIQKANLK